MRDPAWLGGHYYGAGAGPDAGLGVARMVGHVTYLSALALDDKFGRRLQFADDIRYTITEPEFEVESYLRHQAGSFVKRFDANTYLYTSRALTYFDLARQYGKQSWPYGASMIWNSTGLPRPRSASATSPDAEGGYNQSELNAISSVRADTPSSARASDSLPYCRARSKYVSAREVYR